MKFLCGSCRTKYQISEEKVRGKVLTIRCQSCGSKIRVREPQQALAPGEAYLAEAVVEEDLVSSTVRHRAVAANAGPHIPTSDLGVAAFSPEDEAPTRIAVKTETPKPEAAIEWFTAIDGKQFGPFTHDEVLRQMTARELLGANYLWHAEMDGWKRIRELPDFAKLLPAEAKKSKTPPPPLPSRAPSVQVETSEERALGEIVDLAEKRAEVERTKKVDLSSSPRMRSLVAKPDEQEERTEHEASKPNPAAAPVPAASTPVSSPKKKPVSATATPVSKDKNRPLEAIALVATTPVAGKTTSQADLAADLFSSLPSLHNDAEQPQRESTRFFIAAAGVHREKSRNMLGVVIAIGVVVVLGVFITAWASGFVSLPIPAAVNPFAADRELAAREALDNETGAGEGDEEDVRALGGKRPKRAKRAKVAVAKETEKSAGPRGDAELEVIKFDANGESRLDIKLPEAELPESRPEDMLPQPDGVELSATVVNQMIASRKSSVRICYQEHLRSNQNLRGKVLVEIHVKPSGDVAKVDVMSREHRGGIGTCIADRIRDWKFPTFGGRENAIVQANFVLEKD